MKIKTKLIIYFLIVVLVPLFTLSFTTLRSSQASLSSHQTTELGIIAEKHKDQIQLYFKSLEGRMTDFSSDGKIKSCLANITNNPAGSCTVSELNNHLKVNKIPAVEGLVEVNVVNLSGTIVSSSNNESVGIDVGKEGYFVNSAKNSKAIWLGKTNDKTLIISTVPIQRVTGGNELLGYISGVIKTDDLQKMISSREGLGDTGEVLLATNEIGDSSKINYLFERKFENYINPQINSSEKIAEPMRRALNREDLLSNDSLDYRGVPVIAVSKYIDENSNLIGLVVKEDKSELQQSLNDQLITTVVLSVFALLLALIIAYVIAESLSKPLKELSEVSKEVEKSNYDINISQNTMDSSLEMGDFSRQFLSMISNLRNLYSSLDQKVKEKTEKLEESLEATKELNKIMIDRELKMIELKAEIEKLKNNNNK